MARRGNSQPPQAHRFAKGQSGNRRGRPKGAHNVKTIVRKVAAELHGVTIQDDVVRQTTVQLILRALSAKAMSGDIAASRELDRLRQRYRSPEASGVVLFFPDNGRD